MKTLDAFTEAYIECALWSSNCGYGRLTRKLEQQIIRDCQTFQADNAELLERWYTEAGETAERAGHDFWLTRNRHGAGFWDRWGSQTPQAKIGRKLTDAAHAYGEVFLTYSRGKVTV